MDKTQLSESFTLYRPKNAMDKLPNKEWTIWTKQKTETSSNVLNREYIPKNAMDKQPHKEWTLYQVTLWTKQTNSHKFKSQK